MEIMKWSQWSKNDKNIILAKFWWDIVQKVNCNIPPNCGRRRMSYPSRRSSIVLETFCNPSELESSWSFWNETTDANWNIMNITGCKASNRWTQPRYRSRNIAGYILYYKARMILSLCNNISLMKMIYIFYWCAKNTPLLLINHTFYWGNNKLHQMQTRNNHSLYKVT